MCHYISASSRFGGHGDIVIRRSSAYHILFFSRCRAPSYQHLYALCMPRQTLPCARIACWRLRRRRISCARAGGGVSLLSRAYLNGKTYGGRRRRAAAAQHGGGAARVTPYLGACCIDKTTSARVLGAGAWRKIIKSVRAAPAAVVRARTYHRRALCAAAARRRGARA